MSNEPRTPSLKAPRQIVCDLPDAVHATIATLQSRTLRKAVAERCRETLDLATKYAFYPELIEYITRGELLRLLPLEIQARIFSFIRVEERMRVLETISGGVGDGLTRAMWKKIRRQSVATADQRVQVNFRRAMLESYKSVKTIKDLGPKWSKLQLLQATGGQLENLQTRFPKLQVHLDASELQAYIYIHARRLWIIHLNGRKADFNFTMRYDEPYDVKFVKIDSTSVVMLICWLTYSSVEMFNLNLIDMSATECAPQTQRSPACYVSGNNSHAAVVSNGFLYIPSYSSGDRSLVQRRYRCYRYNINIPSKTWEPIADMNHAHTTCKFVTWNDSLYAVGGHRSQGAVEQYDPENDKWTVVFKQSKLEGVIRAAIVVDNTLYCCCRTEHDYEWLTIWKVDMRTGKECEALHRGLPAFCDRVCTECEQPYRGFPDLSDYPFHTYFFEKEGQVGLLLTEPKGTELKWETFVLDQSIWRSVESGSTPSNDNDINKNDWRNVVPLFI